MTDSSLMKRKLKHLWDHGFTWGIVIALIGLLVWFYLGGPSFISAPRQAKPVPPVKPLPEHSLSGAGKVAPLPPPESTANLKNQLSHVLSGIKQANQQKDLAKLLSYYSPNFPRLTNRAQSISKAWKAYNYVKMEFRLADVKSLTADTASARVTWDVEARHLDTLKSKNISKTYLIKFIKQSGEWRIEAMHHEP